MIFKSAIFSELSSTAGAVFTVLFSIIFSVGLVRILGDAAGGQVDNTAVFQLVALAALTNLPTVLTLTLFVSVLIALSRSFRDSEMVVWFSSGQSLLAWIGPVLRFAASIVVLVALRDNPHFQDGRLLKFGVAGYAVVRFFIEFVRNNEVIAWGLTGQQFFCLALLALVAGYFVRAQRRRPATQVV